MAKNAFPAAAKSGGGALPKLIGTLFLFGTLAMVVKHPAESAQTVSGLLSGAGAMSDAIATFVQMVAA